jgi:7-cyano-7-deazaguanine synthase
MLPKAIMLLLSGGMDSVVMLYDLHAQGHKIHCLLFDYKQRHVQELVWARHHAGRLGILWTTMEVPQLKGSQLTDDTGSFVVPNRNAILISLAVNLAVTAKSDTVAYACNADDASMFPDCRQSFVAAYNKVLQAAEIPVEVCAPYIDKHKWEIGDLGRQLGVNFYETWSCYRGGEKPCRVCPACIKREEAIGKKGYLE